MSKSKGNYIGLTESPTDMFGKTMSISDALMPRWYNLLLGKPVAHSHPMEAKKALAHAIVEQYHGRAAADAARAEFDQKFSKKDYNEVADALTVPAEIGLLDLVEKTGKFKSRSDIRRLIEQGGVTLDGAKLTDPKTRVTVQPGQILKAGKLVIVKLIVS
jgi:tyrosyl-tRNA synthetase